MDCPQKPAMGAETTDDADDSLLCSFIAQHLTETPLWFIVPFCVS